MPSRPWTGQTLEDLIERAKRNDPLTIAEREYLQKEQRRRRKALAGPAAADAHRERMAQRARDASRKTRNIGPIPPCANPERRDRCERSLADFIMEYSPEGLSPFSDDHLRVIKRIETSIFAGGRFVEAVYRGFGKTTISNLAVIWSLLYGHKQFVLLIRANGSQASSAMDAIRGVLDNEAIREDFPSVGLPIAALEGVAQRAGTQLYDRDDGSEASTEMHWSGDEIHLPFVNAESNPAAGSVIFCAGITSSKIRGLQHRRPDGVTIRPDFAIIDDPQDEESARSPMQVSKRLNIIMKAILKSAGHKHALSVVMPCTVINKDDLVDQLLDNKKNSSWQGERIKLVKTWATQHDDMWMGRYQEIRTEYDPGDPDDFVRARQDATAYYVAHRAEMDAGAVVSWEHCYDPDREVSAIQHAYNALIDDGPEVFASEFQNEPMQPPEEEGQLQPETIWQRIQHGNARGIVDSQAHRLTAFVDVQKECLFWMICAWRAGFTGQIVDYGGYPQQTMSNYSVRDLKVKLAHKHPGEGQEGRWRAALDYLVGALCSREYQRDDGSAIKISRLLVDANDGSAAQTIFDFCRQSQWGTVAMPACGRGVTASSVPFSDYKRKAGDYVSPYNWRIPSSRGKVGNARYILSDIYYWKTFARARLNTAPGDPGSLAIYGKEANGNAPSHAMLGDHCTAEYSIRTSGRGRTVDEWKTRPGREEHYWDCLVGCMIAASEQGIVLGQTEAEERAQLHRQKTRKEKLARLGRVLG